MKEKLNLIATSAFGLESLVALELKKLGHDTLKVGNGRVDFKGDWSDIPRLNLWLRTADRVLLVAGEFPAKSFEELFEGVRSLPWSDLMPLQASFPVQGKSVSSRLFSVSDCQAIVKKAIVEQMKTRYHQAWFPENGPSYPIMAALLKDVATITVDTSGPGLHKRGYRTLNAPAPLKETLGAALVMISRWKADRPFIDPFCGSGTLPLEAAMIGRNIAPGLNRSFVSEKWRQPDGKSWGQAREEAHDMVCRNQPLGIWGYDIDEKVLAMARQHARQAGLDRDLHFQRQDIAHLRSSYQYGYLVTNPPYGQRLGQEKEVTELYRSLQDLSRLLPTWSIYLLSSHPGFEKLFGRRADKRRKLYNGRLQCTYYQFFGPRPERLSGPFAADQQSSD